jgi:hypothetical protein
MALIGLVLLALVIIFFIIFSTPQARQGEAFHLISGFMEGLIINFLLIILLILLASLLSSAPGFLTHIPICGTAIALSQTTSALGKAKGHYCSICNCGVAQRWMLGHARRNWKWLV